MVVIAEVRALLGSLLEGNPTGLGGLFWGSPVFVSPHTGEFDFGFRAEGV